MQKLSAMGWSGFNNSVIPKYLKTTNLMMEAQNFVKVVICDVAQYQNNDGVMVIEFGTCGLMAPKISTNLLIHAFVDLSDKLLPLLGIE